MSAEAVNRFETRPHGTSKRELQGVGLVLISAAGFGALGVLAQLAYNSGVSVLGLLTGRFVVASTLLWLITIALRRPMPTRRGLIAGVALGAGYSSMALCFAASLRHVDAGLADLLLFAYPVLVSVGAVALGRERWTRRHGTALTVATAGILLALAGSGTGMLNPLDVALALGAAVLYAAYVLSSSSLLRGTDPLVLAALIASGAAIVFCADSAIAGQLAPRGGLTGVGLVIAVALSSSVLGTSAFMTGVRKLGASRASIVSSAEPALTALLAFLALGQTFAPAQLLGAACVLASVPILELKSSVKKSSPARGHRREASSSRVTHSGRRTPASACTARGTATKTRKR